MISTKYLFTIIPYLFSSNSFQTQAKRNPDCRPKSKAKINKFRIFGNHKSYFKDEGANPAVSPGCLAGPGGGLDPVAAVLTRGASAGGRAGHLDAGGQEAEDALALSEVVAEVGPSFVECKSSRIVILLQGDTEEL